jgi:hypothetical protein
LCEGAADVASDSESSVVVAFTKAATATLRLAAPSPSDCVVFELAPDGGSWTRVARIDEQRGRTPVRRWTVRPGTYRWRATFVGDDIHGPVRAAVESAEGTFTVGAGESADVVVPARVR